MKALISFALVFSVIIPLAAAEVDTFPYLDLRSQISQTEASLIDAQTHNDYEAVITINKQLESLNQQLFSPRMQFLQKYTELMPFVEEIKSIQPEIEENLPPGTLTSPLGYAGSQLALLSEAEFIYNAQNYSRALSKLDDVVPIIPGIPASLASSASGAMKDIINSERGSLPAGDVQMMENARSLMNDAERLYKEASQKAFSKTAFDYLTPLSNGRELLSESFELFSRQGAEAADNMILKLTLILAPLCISVLIGAYLLSQKSPGNPVKNTLSKTKLKAGVEDLVERRLEITNTEPSQLFVKVADFPPPVFATSDFTAEPAQKAGNGLLWELTLKPKEHFTIRYKLKGSLQAGSMAFPACSAIFALEDGPRKFIGTPSKITIA